MKKLIALIGAITLTTSVAAVTVVSCGGMRTHSIEFTINGKKYESATDWMGQPQNLMMDTLELLTFNERKYTNDKVREKVMNTLGVDNSGKTNRINGYTLYELTKDENLVNFPPEKQKKYRKLNDRLNGMNNDGIKSFDFGWGSSRAEEQNDPNVTHGKDLNFTVITQEIKEVDGTNYGLEPKLFDEKKPSFTYEEVQNNVEIWGSEESGEKLKKAFIENYENLNFTIIGGWDKPENKGLEIIKPAGEDEAKKFNENLNFTYIEKGTEENKYYELNQMFGITNINEALKTTINFGDPNVKESIDIELEIKNSKLILMPKIVNGKTTTNGDVKTNTYIMTWIPQVYTFTDTYKNWEKNINIFEDIEMSLI